MSRSIPDKQKYCGNCGAALVFNSTCPHKCSNTMVAGLSSPDVPTVPIGSLVPAVAVRAPRSSSRQIRIYQALSGVVLLLLIGAGLLILSQMSKGAVMSKNTQPSNQSIGGASTRPIALVYRNDSGAAGCDGCSEAVAALLQSDTTYDFDVRYVGPNESLSVQAGLALPGVVLYAQPGGNGTVETAYAEMRRDVPAIRNFVRNGGRFLGFCMGAYLEGTGPGFNLLSDVGADTDQYIASSGATITTDENTIIQVQWRGQTRSVFFQDGNYFTFSGGTNGATILATYSNGKAAAIVARYGKGKVGGVGPHPEADASWYSGYNLTNPGSTADLGHDLIDTTMQ